MDQAAVDGFLRHYRQLAAEDLAALDLRREELTPEAIAALDQVLASAEKRAQVAAVADDIRQVIAPKPLGLGGWLWLLIIGFAIYGFDQIVMIPVFFAQAEEHTPGLVASAGWHDFKLAMWPLLGLQMIAGFYMAIRLYFQRNRRTIHLVVAALWLLAPVTDLLILTAIKLTLAADPIGAILTDRMLEVNRIKWLSLSALWTLYLLKSKRVKALYPDTTPPSPAG